MTETSTQAATALVALMKIRGVGRRAALRIVRETDAKVPADLFQQVVVENASRAGVGEDQLIEAWLQTEMLLARSEEAGIQAFAIHDEGYPSRLRDIPDPPAVLFVKGDATSLHAPASVAIVGTREPTSYGAKVARKSAAAAVDAGFVIVSGLAHGCDTHAHTACLEANGIGIVVLAHGLDKVYPAGNRTLADSLLESGGCLVSEYPLGVAPVRTAFAERDRIQSGLSDGILVIETDLKGGTMHTVRFSRDQRRGLACIDHPENWRTEEKTRGNQKLIADGLAIPIANGDALLGFLESLKAGNKSLVKEPTGPAEQRSWSF